MSSVLIWLSKRVQAAALNWGEGEIFTDFLRHSAVLNRAVNS